MTSMAYAMAMPAPGPATVRLALIRKGIELFGLETMRQEIFPTVRAVPIRIRPPERVAISQHRLRAYKWELDKQRKQEMIQESVILREMAQADGPLAVYLQIPVQEEQRYRALLSMIGYWGQTSSFACCAGISHAEPRQEECATPLRELDLHTPLGHFFSCLVSEFRHNALAWEDIMPTLHKAKGPALLLDVYVWPLRLVRSDGRGRLFVRHALGEAAARRDGFLSRCS
jgi:hypothetical protein